MSVFFALAPCAVVVVAVLFGGWSGLAAAAASLAAMAGLVAGGAFDPPTSTMLWATLADASLLTLLVSATLVPGVIFIEATRRLQAPQAISHVVELLRLPKPQAAVLISLGLGVLVESLTGMGVSLLLTVPMLIQLLPRQQAIATALVGMSLMPWGALALAGTLGATLASIDVEKFGVAVWIFSGVVAAVLPSIATAIAGGRSLADQTLAVLAGVVLWFATGLATLLVGMPLAGVFGGLALLAFLGSRAERSPHLLAALHADALKPYAVLIAAVTLQTLIATALARRGMSLNISTGRVSFAVLTSPGVSLTVATLLAGWRLCDTQLVRDVAKRSWRAVATVALFMLTARLLVASGATDALTASIRDLSAVGALVAVTGLGAIGGFVTGSGVTGNALFLPTAADTGAALHAKNIYAAIASAAAGHVAMASLPVAALLLAALPDRTAADDRHALKAGLLLAGGCVIILLLVGVSWLAVQPQ